MGIDALLFGFLFMDLYEMKELKKSEVIEARHQQNKHDCKMNRLNQRPRRSSREYKYGEGGSLV